MLEPRQIERVTRKLARFRDTLIERIFARVAAIPTRRFETRERLYAVPAMENFVAAAPGDEWGIEHGFCWERGVFTPGADLAGKPLYVYPRTTRFEGMLWVDGEPAGILSGVRDGRADHYCSRITAAAVPGTPIDLAFEWYAGHEIRGEHPFENQTRSYRYAIGETEIRVRDDEILDFAADLAALLDLEKALDAGGFRRAAIQRTLLEVHRIVYADPDQVAEITFRDSLREAAPLLKEALRVRAGAGAGESPFVGLVGHAHMDTAWLWPLEETIKKCARTYSNQLALMDQYPEYVFTQSSAYHLELMRRHYPGLYARIAAMIRAGRYEPNGAVWIECDCNIVSGESLVRQFLWGQRYTRERFGFVSDAFWLPDTFGYNAAIPQIMRLAGVRYFLTQKISWNDTNPFPYDTFYWQGIDGTRVLTHFNKIHVSPSPSELIAAAAEIREKTVSDQRLFAFGYGDGGGGPRFEMLEMARRAAGLDGVPRTAYTTVSAFMRGLETALAARAGSASAPSVYAGELYLEIHRGVLTNQHQIKRNNRLAEIAIHDLEFALVRDAVSRGVPASGAETRPLVETLLVNQFHDILPGTCIPAVHDRSVADTAAVIAEARARTAALIAGGDAADAADTADADADAVTLTNTLSFSRDDVVYLDEGEYDLPDGAAQQDVDSLLYGNKTAVSGIVLPGLASVAVARRPGARPRTTPVKKFTINGDHLETPFAIITFAPNGTIASFLDKTAGGRELRGDGYPLGTYLMAEDVPLTYDAWDIDADIEYKFRDASTLLERRVVSEGPVELRIRARYRISERSTVDQDLIVYAASPLVAYEVRIDWRDEHRFLKAAFDTTVFAPEARCEIPFGHVRRPVFRSTSVEKAKFEVSNHKFTDLSESRYGVAILNDSKYGVSLRDSSVRLSLHKGGARPDYRADAGVHDCRYAFLPHAAPFSTASVARPAYAFNYRVVVTPGRRPAPPLFTLDSPTVIAETIKPCEDEARAYIVRLYESEGARAEAVFEAPAAREIAETTALEDFSSPSAPVTGGRAALVFRPFEIKTLRVAY